MKVELNKMFVDDETRRAVLDVLEGGRYVKGPEAKALEEAFCKTTGARYAVSCSSGTDSLMLAFKALELRPKGEVLVPSHTFAATINGFWHFGARPRFVDIDPATYTMDIADLKKKISKDTVAIAPVHLYGHPVDMDPVLELARERDVPVVADACQSHGALYKKKDVGVLGDIVCYSFFPSKIIAVAGEGGIITTDNEDLYRHMSALKDHGRLPGEKDIHDMPGFNMRLSEMMAVIAKVQLSHLPQWVAKRRSIAKRYNKELEGLGDLVLPVERPWARHPYYLYVVRTKKREGLRQALEKNGVATGVHYPVPVHKMPFITGKPRLPVTERIVNEILSLPMNPLLADEEQDHVVDSIRRFFKKGA
jgi:dTDP-4-amino-4,6-dideoxygalactose transaminase